VAVYGPGIIYLGTPVGTWNVDSEKDEELETSKLKIMQLALRLLAGLSASAFAVD
jgi:hypothetical protein